MFVAFKRYCLILKKNGYANGTYLVPKLVDQPKYSSFPLQKIIAVINATCEKKQNHMIMITTIDIESDCFV